VFLCGCFWQTKEIKNLCSIRQTLQVYESRTIENVIK
jgi:hypothetical protein